MKAPAHRLWIGDILPRASRLNTFLLAAAVAIVTANLAARAAETTADDRAGQADASTEADAKATTGDYRLAPGDRLTLVVYDQPQLSGEFIVDRGGGILLPLAGSVSLNGLTLAEAQQLIQERFADGVLVKPAVSVRITEYRPVFVTGQVKKPGSYPFILGESVKAAIATAGGSGQSLEQPFNAVMSDYISAQEHVRQLEANQTTLTVRKARLEAQRDGRDNFVTPVLVGLNRRNVEFDQAYASENDTFSRLSDTYRHQIEALQDQRPRIQQEIDAVDDQIAKQRERLNIVVDHLTDLETLFGKGLLRKEVLLNQQIEKSLTEAQLSNLEAQVAHLRQNMGDLDVRLGDLKSTHEHQTLTELQDASQRLIDIENSLGPARRLLEVKAQAAGGDAEDSSYEILISRVQDGHLATFNASDDTMLSPGDVVEIKMKRHAAQDLSPPWTEAVQDLTPTPAIAEGSNSQ
jgi:polysaccharide biosynthesis/export protein